MRNNDDYKFVYLLKVFPLFVFFWIYNREVLKTGVSKMKKFLHFGMVIVIVVLFFHVSYSKKKCYVSESNSISFSVYNIMIIKNKESNE